MAFKKVKDYNEEKFGGYFLLRNDMDSADVVFLYQSPDDVLVADVHYIKSADYSGYVHCCGRGCPACSKGIRTQTKLFIPLYNITADEIQFFDRSMRFEPQLQQDVFANYPNPSEFVFRITRHGAAGSVDTTYEIQAVGKNTFKPFAQILVEKGITLPEHYNTICREVSAHELQNMLVSGDKHSSGYSPNEDYQYNATPRGTVSQPTVATPTSYIPPETLPEAEPSIDTPSDSPDMAYDTPSISEAIAESDAEDLGDPEF